MKTSVNRFVSTFLCCFSQIMLQRSMLTGGFFVIGLGINSPIMLAGACIAIISALITAKLLRYDSNSINTGLYGFNAALVGIAVFFFLPSNLLSLIVVILAGALSAIIMHLMLYLISASTLHLNLSLKGHSFKYFPIFTAPFIISIWLLLFLISTLGIDTISANNFSPEIFEQSFSDFYAVMQGIAQVMFQDYWLSGVFFAFGLLLHSYSAAIFAVLGSLAGVTIARTLNFSEDLVFQGLYSFNACLTAIAIAQRYSKQGVKKMLVVSVGVVISVLLTKAFEYITLPALTAPFVLASWLVIALVKINADEAEK